MVLIISAAVGIAVYVAVGIFGAVTAAMLTGTKFEIVAPTLYPDWFGSQGEETLWG